MQVTAENLISFAIALLIAIGAMAFGYRQWRREQAAARIKNALRIAMLEGRRRIDWRSGWFPSLMIFLGMLGMFAGLTDTSAIRFASYAALWTGWNVLWGLMILNATRTEYTVYRVPPEDEDDR
jgi:uncharacterized membrane protein